MSQQARRAVDRLDRGNRTGRSRRGQGTLLLVICIFMAVGFIVGIARHFLSSQVRNNAQGAAIGSLAVEIARSAIQEAFYYLQVRLDDPDNQTMLKSFRSESGPGTSFPTLPIDVPEVRKELATDPLLSGFEIFKDSVAVNFVASRPLRAVPYEYVGVFKFLAQVNHKPTGVRRTLTVERSFKMNLLSTPRPFDQFTLSVLQPENLWGYTEANARIRDILKIRNDLRTVDLPKIQEILLDVISGSGGRKGADSRLNDAEGAGITTKNPFTPGAKVNYYAKGGLTEIISSIKGKLDGNVAIAPLQFSSDVTQPWHFLPQKVVISTKAETIPLKSGASGPGTEPLPGSPPMDLSFLNLSRRLNDQITRTSNPRGIDASISSFQKNIQLYTDEANAINKLVQKSFDVSSQSQAQAYLDESDSRQLTLKKHMQALERDMDALDIACAQFEGMVKSFTDFFIESADDAADWIRGFAYKFQRTELEAKANFRFDGKVDGQEAGARFVSFLKSYNSVGRPLNGIVLIDNLGGAPLNLSQIQIDGKLVIACTGDVNLSDVTLIAADEANRSALLTIQCDGNMRVSGRVEASLVPRGQFIPAPSARLSGNLILDLIDNPDQMVGFLENPHIRDSEHGRYFSGVTSKTSPDYTYASWTPWQSWAQISRN